MKTRKTTKLIYRKLAIPFVTLRLADGTEGTALVDTGSESSVIDKAFVKAHKKQFQVEITDKKIEQVGFVGKTSIHIIKLAAPVFFKTYRGRKWFRVEVKDAMLYDLSHINQNIAEQEKIENAVQAIFGSDLFKALQAEINYQNNTLTVNSEE